MSTTMCRWLGVINLGTKLWFIRNGRFWGMPQIWTLNDLYPILYALLIYTPFFNTLNFKRQNYPYNTQTWFSFFWKLERLQQWSLWNSINVDLPTSYSLVGTLCRRKSRTIGTMILISSKASIRTLCNRSRSHYSW